MNAKEFQKFIGSREVIVHHFTYEQLLWRLFPTSFTQAHNSDEWLLALFKVMKSYPDDDASGWRNHLVRLFPQLGEIDHATWSQVFETLLHVTQQLQRKNLGQPLPRAFRRYFKE